MESASSKMVGKIQKPLVLNFCLLLKLFWPIVPTLCKIKSKSKSYQIFTLRTFAQVKTSEDNVIHEHCFPAEYPKMNGHP